ncbi:MAG: 16S rRNA (uracil(1498)-N(3))-methyltransferase [Alphaproteobacteria bacterium]
MSSFIPRLYVKTPLKQGEILFLSDTQTHYLVNVLRSAPEETVKVFNGKDGEWSATLKQESKKKFFLVCQEMVKPQTKNLDIWLAFCPLKKNPLNILIEKGTELGTTKFIPVKTDYTDFKSYSLGKIHLHAIEAAEQSEQLQVPEFAPFVSLKDLLHKWPQERVLYACLERSDESPTLLKALDTTKKSAILIGPEGGFSDAEKTLLRNHPQTKIVTLGASILRAETAAIVSLGCFVQKSLD